MNVDTVVLPPDEDYPLYTTANRYWVTKGRVGQDEFANDAASSNGDQGLSLIMLHSTSFHKETWEACLETLMDSTSSSLRSSIREAWSIESPNHGHSATLNKNALVAPPFDTACESF